jgi:SAM-dependent methyltransferase
MSASLPPSYFEAMYAENPDPWDFETSPYEAAKYAATLAALPRSHYRNAFEIGCSIGVLTERLGERCAALLAVDVAEQALRRARERCRRRAHVRFTRMRVPEQFPDDDFDLIVVSEVAYYWSRPDLKRAQRRIVAHLAPGGHLLLVHWTPYVADYPLTGDQVHDAFLAITGRELRHVTGQRAERYRLDVFERADDARP